MSYDMEIKKKFIDLRTEGLSFQKISEQINVSKPTLMVWEKEFNSDIKELRFIKLEALKNEFQMGKEARIKYLGEIHKKMLDELESRDFSDISTNKLMNMYFSIKNKLKDEFRYVSFESKEKEEMGDLNFFVMPKYTWSLDD